jgi:hypothetical protein
MTLLPASILGVCLPDAYPLTCPAREALPVATLLLVQLSGSLAYSNLITIRWSHQQGGIIITRKHKIQHSGLM